MSYNRPMKRIALILSLTLASPALASETEGRSLMEQGAEMFLRGMMREMEPALKDLEALSREMEPALRSFALEMGPALKDLMGMVEDWSAYEPPVLLPNGDILIRRRPGTEPGEIEL